VGGREGKIQGERAGGHRLGRAEEWGREVRR